LSRLKTVQMQWDGEAFPAELLTELRQQLVTDLRSFDALL